MKRIWNIFKKKQEEAPPQAVPESTIYWVRWEHDTSGRYWVTVNGSKTSPEFTFDDLEQMRRMYDNMIERYHLISLAPDFAANPHKTDAISCSKEKISVVFSDLSSLSSAEQFKTSHDQIQKMKIKQLISAAGLAQKDWVSCFDTYQFVMIRRSIIKNIRLQDAFTVFDLDKRAEPYVVAWEDKNEAAQKFKEFQAQLNTRS